MRVWTVHTGRGAAKAGAADPARPDPVPEAGHDTAARPPVLVPEGFSWLAFFFSLLWLAWHRLWLAALGYLALALVLGLVLPPGPGFVAGLALQFLLGAHAHDLRRRKLARRGYVQTGVVAAPDQDRALARLLEARPELTGPLALAAMA